MGQRLSGRQGIPPRARARALDAAKARGFLAAAPGLWVGAGPANIGGRVTAVGLDPHDTDRLWLGSAEGGVFHSIDGGVSWTPVFDAQTALSIGSLATHPSDSAIVYAGTGEDNGGGFSYDGEGVFKTTNGGATWTNLGLGEVRRIGRMAIDPLNPQRVFVAAGGDWFNRDENRGIYRSTDGGASWSKVLFVADDAGGIDVAIDPAAPSRIYAAIWQRQSLGSTWYIGGPESGIYRSVDGGDSWSRLTNGLPAGSNVGRIGLAVSRSQPSTVYALILSSQGTLLGVTKTANAGDSWTLVNTTAPLGDFGYYFGNIRVDPADSNVVYLLDVALLKSTDGGVSFTVIAPAVHPDWHDLLIAGRLLLGGNDAGFFRSRNSGSSWTQAATLPITQVYDLGIDRAQPQRRWIGSQDTGTILTATGGAADWQVILSGDGLQCEVDPVDSNLVVAERQYGAIYRSANGGTSWALATTGIDPSERRNWSAPIAIDPASPTTLFTATQRVYRSLDSALSWSPISPDLTNGPSGPSLPLRASRDGGADHLQGLIEGTITVVAPSPVDGRILWAGTDDGNVWVSGNSGSSWQQVNPAGPAYWVTDIAGDPFDASAAYLTVSGYRQGDRLPYVRVTRDLGATWADLSGTLPQVPINTILPDPAWRGRLFVGSDLGVHLSDDGGATWSIMNGGMPYVVVLDLALDEARRTLFAGTHGRSVFTYELNQLPPADGDADGVDNNHDCALADPSAYSPPLEVSPVVVEDGPDGGALLFWPSLGGQAGPGTVYDVAAGDLSSLPTAGTAGSSALACGLSATTAVDPAIPQAGAAIYYMVRGRNACAAGTWGESSQLVERLSPACP
ncbi:MAG TPA: hypothetical protein VGR67_07220 [Candidatus Polarisedimenticolia bacterium]|nr:hypothetical protein [Candidatus Polarisedimenticolia bacterium]